MSHLLVIYDDGCSFCERCRHWLQGQPTWLPLELVPASAATGWSHLQRLPWDLTRELTVISDQGQVWTGAEAFIMCLWAQDRYRDVAEALAEPWLRWLAVPFFRAVSEQRDLLSSLFGKGCDGHCGGGASAGVYR